MNANGTDGLDDALPLDGELTIYTAAERRAGLLAWLDAGGSVLDLSQVTDCDTAGVQLLVATRHTLEARGRSLSLRAASAAVRDALAAYGLDAQPLTTAPAEALET